MKLAVKYNPEKHYLELDIHKLKYDRNGAKDFVWPYPYRKRQDFADDIFANIITYIKSLPEPDRTYCKIVSKFFLAETTSIFWGDALKHTFEEHNIIASVPENWPHWPYLLSGKAPPYPAFLQSLHMEKKTKNKQALLKTAISKAQKVLNLIKFQKGGINFDGLKINPLSKHILKNNIIATQRIETICAHAKASKADVYYFTSYRWFKPVLQADISKAIEQQNPEIIDGLLQIASNAYKNANITFPEHSQNYIREILRLALALIKIHYTRLHQQPENLPKEIWTGTGGNIWDLMLRLAAREHGAKVTGHDHGAGLAHVDNPMMGFFEFWGCDAFKTFNQNQADELKKSAKNWTLLDDTMPDISGIEGQKIKTVKTYTRHINASQKPKKIMVMTEIYDRDRGRPGPSCPDIIQADWQARIISNLKEWGYDVIMKLHPESPLLPPECFQTEMGAQLITQRIEEVLDHADVIIYDCVYTTSLRVAIETNIPFVLIDFYNHPWTGRGKELLEKRCGFVDGGFDDLGRRNADWNAIKNAIESAPEKANNHEFFNYYYA